MQFSQTVGLETKNKKHLAFDKENVQDNIPVFFSDDQVMHSSQTVERSMIF